MVTRMIMSGDLMYALRPWEQEGSIPSAPPATTTDNGMGEKRNSRKLMEATDVLRRAGSIPDATVGEERGAKLAIRRVGVRFPRLTKRY